MRAHRRNLAPKDQQEASRNLARHGRKITQIMNAGRIASYAPFDGEICPQHLLNIRSFRALSLPKIHNYRTRKMHFLDAGTSSTGNRFGIPEPKNEGHPIPVNNHQLVLVPLVAFDRSGNRLGMGAGYYDRALSSLAHQTATKPFLVGLAHHFQEVKSLNANAWDVPLDAILTDREFITVDTQP